MVEPEFDFRLILLVQPLIRLSYNPRSLFAFCKLWNICSALNEYRENVKSLKRARGKILTRKRCKIVIGVIEGICHSKAKYITDHGYNLKLCAEFA